MSSNKKTLLLKTLKEISNKLSNTFLEKDEPELKVSDYKGDILLWASYGTIIVNINTTGTMNIIKPVAATICFGILTLEVVDAIKTGKLSKDFNQVISNKQFRKVK